MKNLCVWDSSKAKNRVLSWLNPKQFDPRRLRGVLMGITITTSLGEICAYKLIQQDIKSGEIPFYTPDILIVALSVFEALVAPLVSWWGYGKRRSMLLAYSSLVTVCCISWFFMPKVEERSLSGVVLLSRVLVLILGERIVTRAVEEKLSIQTLGFVLGLTVNVIQFMFIVPKVVPEVDGVQQTAISQEGRGFFLSLGRVMYNSVAMTQMLAMGLMAAALWGYAYNEGEIIKVKFNMVRADTGTVHLVEFIQYFFLVVIVAYAGVKFSAPVLKEFCNVKAMKQTIVMSVLACVAFVVLTAAPRCDLGEVAGVGDAVYAHPECSLPCDCKPRWNEFQPVCVKDEMVTYVSPCQAGCRSTENINGFFFYSNCTCAAGGRAMLGACSDSRCSQSYRLHGTFFYVLVTFTLLVFQAQGVLLLRVVDKRDKSVVMGLAWSMVALFSFVCGHLIFLGIGVATCDWFEVEKCHLQSRLYPVFVGATCAFLAFLSIVISICSCICLRVSKKIRLDQSTQL